MAGVIDDLLAAPASSAAIDPVTLRVVGGAFNAIAREMAQVLYRMSNSSIIARSRTAGWRLATR